MENVGLSYAECLKRFRRAWER